MLEIGICYCGGCNPRFDRVAQVEHFKRALPQLQFVPVSQAGSYAAVVVVCGCLTRCVNLLELELETEYMLHLNSPTDAPAIEAALLALQAKHQE